MNTRAKRAESRQIEDARCIAAAARRIMNTLPGALFVLPRVQATSKRTTPTLITRILLQFRLREIGTRKVINRSSIPPSWNRCVYRQTFIGKLNALIHSSQQNTTKQKKLGKPFVVVFYAPTKPAPTKPLLQGEGLNHMGYRKVL